MVDVIRFLIMFLIGMGGMILAQHILDGDDSWKVWVLGLSISVPVALITNFVILY